MKSLGAYTALLLSAAATIILICSVLFYFSQRAELQREVFEEEHSLLLQSLQQRLEKKADIGVTNAISFALSNEIEGLVRAGDREGLLSYTARIGKTFENSSNFKGIRLQIFGADGRTLIRSWKKDSPSDASPPVASLIEAARRERRALSAFTLDDDGLLLRGTALVGNPDNPAGYIQYIQGVGSISRDFAKEGLFFVQLVEAASASGAAAVRANRALGAYRLASDKWFSDDVVARFAGLDFSHVATQRHFSSNGLFVVSEPVRDKDGKTIGFYLLAEPQAEVLAKLEAATRPARYFLAAMLVGFGITFAITFAVLRRKVLTPLGNIKRFAEDVAAGAWDAKPKGRFYFELAVLKQSLLAMVQELESSQEAVRHKSEETLAEAEKARLAAREAEQAKAQAEQAKAEGILFAVRNLRQVVDAVAQTSGLLAQEIRRSSEGSHEQSRQLDAVAAAMEEMNATVMEIARSSDEGAEAADQARIQAQEGDRRVQDAVGAIDAIRGIALNLSTDMAELGRQASGIGQIVNVISDIADQTNLLALNAAIEAARAGDAGRGFAVVADEVRKLAEKTQSATKEVEASVSAIQASTKLSVDNVQHAVGTIESANALAVESGQSLKEIVRRIEAASGRVQAIALSSNQQAETSEQINRSLERIVGIASEGVALMGDASRAVENLGQQAARLGQIICEMEDGCPGGK